MWAKYCRISGLLMQPFSAAGPYGVREIGAKSLTRAQRHIGADWLESIKNRGFKGAGIDD